MPEAINEKIYTTMAKYFFDGKLLNANLVYSSTILL
jgi:hypothetical protein